MDLMLDGGWAGPGQPDSDRCFIIITATTTAITTFFYIVEFVYLQQKKKNACSIWNRDVQVCSQVLKPRGMDNSSFILLCLFIYNRKKKCMFDLESGCSSLLLSFEAKRNGRKGWNFDSD